MVSLLPRPKLDYDVGYDATVKGASVVVSDKSICSSAWYERLRDFLLSKGFIMGKVDTTLFTKKIGKDLFVL